jgi:hypothetical protein
MMHSIIHLTLALVCMSTVSSLFSASAATTSTSQCVYVLENNPFIHASAIVAALKNPESQDDFALVEKVDLELITAISSKPFVWDIPEEGMKTIVTFLLNSEVS